MMICGIGYVHQENHDLPESTRPAVYMICSYPSHTIQREGGAEGELEHSGCLL